MPVMPTLIPGGPDIPTSVLQALEDGELVFFCGAGVSMPAGLPNFRCLTKLLYEAVGEEEEPEERYAIKTGQLDKALGLLETRINPGELRRQVNEILTLSESADLTLHKAILTLAKSSNNILRLVTTNFDNAFEIAGSLEENEVDSAPKLPVPKPSKWHGLIHLHGRIYPQQPERDDIVLTSADFGTAYLSEGWASKFVTELFRHFTVLFIGYSVDDPVMRYLTDALAAERERGTGGFRPSYALAGTQGRQRDRELIKLQWKSKSVRAIFYDSRRLHIKLKHTVETWANMHRLGLQSKNYIIRRHAQDAPTEGVIDDVARRLVWALSEPSGVIAAEFAKIDPAPPLGWLQVFEHPEFKDAKLLSSTAEGTMSTPLVSGGFYRNSQPAVPSKVTEQLGKWLCRHLDGTEFLDWVLDKGGWLHPTLRWFVREALRRSPMPGPQGIIWEILSSDSFANAHARRSFRSSHYLEKLLESPSSPLTRSEMIDLLTPVPQIKAKSPYEKEFLASGIFGTGSIRYLVNVEIDLAGGLEAHHFLEHTLPHAATRADLLLALAYDLTGLLAETMNWFHLFNLASPTFDQSKLFMPLIGGRIKKGSFNNWPHLLELTWDSFLLASQRDERLTAALLARWRTLRFPIFRRLILHAATEISAVDTSMAVDTLLEDDAQALWSSRTQKEAPLPAKSRSPSTRISRSTLDSYPEGPSGGAPTTLSG
jgi:hypothetical protein